MATWSEIKNSDAFHAEDADTKHAIMNDYFENVIKPQAVANGDDVQSVYNDFSNKALSYSADEVASRVQSQLDKAGDVVSQIRSESPEAEYQARRDAVSDFISPSLRGVGGAAVNVANIIPEVGDAFVSAGSWLGNKVGLGDGTYTPAQRVAGYGDDDALISLPESWRPRGTAENVMSEAVPFLLGTGEIKAATKADQMAGRLARNMEEAASGASRRDAAITGLREVSPEEVEAARRAGFELENTPQMTRWLERYRDNGAAAADYYGSRASELGNRIESALALDTTPITGTSGSKVDRLWDAFGRNLQQSTVGTLASNSDGKGDAGDLATDFLINTGLGMGVEGLVGAVKGAARSRNLANLSDTVNRLKAAKEAGDVSAYNDIITDTGLGKQFSDGNYDFDKSGFIRPLTDSMAGRADLINRLADKEGRVGFSTLLNQLSPNEVKVLKDFGINRTGIEGAARVSDVSPKAAEFFGLREGGIEGKRARASGQVLDDMYGDVYRNAQIAERNADIPSTIDNPFSGQTMPNPSFSEDAPIIKDAYSSVMDIANSIKGGDHIKASALIDDFRNVYKPDVLPPEADSTLHSMVNDFKALNGFMKANKNVDSSVTTTINNLIGKALTLGTLGAASGGFVLPAAAYLGRQGLSKAVTKSAGKNIKNVSKALKGEYEAPVADYFKSGKKKAPIRGVYEYISDDDLK